jgi:IS4 transposase
VRRQSLIGPFTGFQGGELVKAPYHNSQYLSICMRLYWLIDVTRQKSNATYTTIEERTLPKKHSVLKDEVILFSGTGAAEKCPYPVFLTNNLKLGATTIAAIYKDRWQIELFFKALKQNLKIKTFVRTTPDAVKIQI